MEMGAAITVLVFSQFSLPVSTSMCITGATVGVVSCFIYALSGTALTLQGLCNGSLRAVNWQRVGLLVFSWIMTIPIAMFIGFASMALILNAPHFTT
jgi:sodium-dependent phosphate transporter